MLPNPAKPDATQNFTSGHFVILSEERRDEPRKKTAPAEIAGALTRIRRWDLVFLFRNGGVLRGIMWVFSKVLNRCFGVSSWF